MQNEKEYLIRKNSNYQLIFFNEAEIRNELKNWSRQDLISWLKWNDRNGIYGDDESLKELGNIMSFEEGIEIIINQITQKN